MVLPFLPGGKGGHLRRESPRLSKRPRVEDSAKKQKILQVDLFLQGQLCHGLWPLDLFFDERETGFKANLQQAALDRV
jgi:hypothetical protein